MRAHTTHEVVFQRDPFCGKVQNHNLPWSKPKVAFRRRVIYERCGASFSSILENVDETNFTQVSIFHTSTAKILIWVKPSPKADAKYQDQLLDYIKTGRSNGRKLHLQVMQLPPGMFFKIHSHPNIEFELTLKGCLEEFRFLFCVDAEELRGDNSSSMPKGPDITKENSNFQHLRVEAGKCMLTEIGSVYQSFTGNKGPCALLVMWSGCHANTHPSQVAKDLEDGRLQPSAGW